MVRSIIRVLSVFAIFISVAALADDTVASSRSSADADRMRLIEDFISGVTRLFDENPHTCYEPDLEEERPDLATRPQS